MSATLQPRPVCAHGYLGLAADGREARTRSCTGNSLALQRGGQRLSDRLLVADREHERAPAWRCFNTALFTDVRQTFSSHPEPG